MKLVIDIPEGMFDELNTCKFPIQDAYRLCDVIEKGKPLPKGHGRLIDADALEHIIGQFPLAWEYGQGVNDCWNALIEAPTIIEADREDEE